MCWRFKITVQPVEHISFRVGFDMLVEFLLILSAEGIKERLLCGGVVSGQNVRETWDSQFFLMVLWTLFSRGARGLAQLPILTFKERCRTVF